MLTLMNLYGNAQVLRGYRLVPALTRQRFAQQTAKACHAAVGEYALGESCRFGGHSDTQAFLSPVEHSGLCNLPEPATR